MPERICTIGKQITIRGELSGAEDLAVEGRIEGMIKLGNHLIVEEPGVVQADLEVEELTVKGAVRGQIQASCCVSLHAGARVEGSIRTPRFIIEDGARFRGRVEMKVELPDGLEA